jgi:3-phenylpropionate/trans-cinnamate dioxygenase ferredoxin component
MSGFVKITTLDELPLGAIRSFEIDYVRFVIVRTEDGLFALADECSHDSAPFSGGRLRGHEIQCPRHGARFDLRSGAVTSPPAVAAIETYEVKVEDNDVLVRLD